MVKYITQSTIPPTPQDAHTQAHFVSLRAVIANIDQHSLHYLRMKVLMIFQQFIPIEYSASLCIPHKPNTDKIYPAKILKVEVSHDDLAWFITTFPVKRSMVSQHRFTSLWSATWWASIARFLAQDAANKSETHPFITYICMYHPHLIAWGARHGNPNRQALTWPHWSNDRKAWFSKLQVLLAHWIKPVALCSFVALIVHYPSPFLSYSWHCCVVRTYLINPVQEKLLVMYDSQYGWKDLLSWIGPQLFQPSKTEKCHTIILLTREKSPWYWINDQWHSLVTSDQRVQRTQILWSELHSFLLLCPNKNTYYLKKRMISILLEQLLSIVAKRHPVNPLQTIQATQDVWQQPHMQ